MPILLIAALIFSIIVIPLVLWRRSHDPDVSRGFFAGFRVSLIILFTSVMVFPFAGWMLSNVYHYLSDPSYEAKVIDIKSELKENEDGSETLMHSKVFEFVDNQGNKHTIISSFSRGKKPVIGTVEKIKYGNGVLLELSLPSIFMTFAGLIMVHLFSLFPVYYLLYATGKNYHAVLEYGIQFVIKGLVPLILSLLIAVFAYKLWLGFSGAEDIPFWAIFLMSIFLFFFMIALFSMTKMFWLKDKT